MKDKVVLEKEEYDEILEELERLSAKDELEHYEWTILSAAFWDSFLTKIVSNFVSVKVWILIFVLSAPYQLLTHKLISADNYTNILIVIAPVVIGLREFSKAKANKDPSSSLLEKTKKIFRI